MMDLGFVYRKSPPLFFRCMYNKIQLLTNRAEVDKCQNQDRLESLNVNMIASQPSYIKESTYLPVITTIYIPFTPSKKMKFQKNSQYKQNLSLHISKYIDRYS